MFKEFQRGDLQMIYEDDIPKELKVVKKHTLQAAWIHNISLNMMIDFTWLIAVGHVDSVIIRL